MTAYANMELSQELYELSGWVGDGAHTISEGFDLKAGPPKYSLGFLMRTLAERCDEPSVARHRVFKRWQARVLAPLEEGYAGLRQFKAAEADIPEDAAAKLAIELLKQGVIDPDGRREVSA